MGWRVLAGGGCPFWERQRAGVPLACGRVGGLLSSSPEVWAGPVLAPQLAIEAPGQPAVVSGGTCPCPERGAVWGA